MNLNLIREVFRSEKDFKRPPRFEPATSTQISVERTAQWVRHLHHRSLLFHLAERLLKSLFPFQHWLLPPYPTVTALPIRVEMSQLHFHEWLTFGVSGDAICQVVVLAVDWIEYEGESDDKFYLIDRVHKTVFVLDKISSEKRKISLFDVLDGENST